MIKKELVKKVSEKTNLPQKEVKEALETAFEMIQEALEKGDKVTIVDFGVFENRDRARKKGKNPSTGEDMFIEAKTIPYFKPSPKFKEIVNKKK